MEIRIHTCGGSVEAFFLDDPALVTRLLKQIQPTKVFSADVLTIAGDYSLTTFVTSRVNRVDLVTNEIVPWELPADISSVVELAEEEFQERSRLNDSVRLERRQSPKQTGDSVKVFVNLEMIGGRRIYLAGSYKVPFEAERLQRLRMLFSAPALHFPLRHGGTTILNLKNLVRVSFNPGPDVTPVGAWPAHHLSQGQEPAQVIYAFD